MQRNLSSNDREIVDLIESYDSSNNLGATGNDVVPGWLSRLEELASLASIKYLLPLLIHETPQIRSAAFNKIHGLYQQVKDEDLAWLDENMRPGHYWHHAGSLRRNWSNLSAQVIREYPYMGEERLTWLSILCSHTNGYLRQAALIQLAQSDIKYALRMLFVRVNDWTGKIRDIAHNALSIKIASLSEKEVVKFLIFVDQLRIRCRHDHSQLIQKIEERLNSTKGQEALISQVSNSGFRLARASFQLASRLIDDKTVLFEIGKKHQDALIRSWSFNLAKTVLNSDELNSYLQLASQDRYAPLRKRIMIALVEQYPEHSKDALLASLKHANAGVREVAAFYLKSAHQFHAVDYYRDQIKSDEGGCLEGIILGLSEVGQEGDWPSIQQYEYHSRPKVQAAVITASHKLSLQSLSWYLRKIEYACPSAQSSAKRVVRDFDYVELNEIEALHKQFFTGTAGFEVRRLALRYSQWTGLILLLEAIHKCGADQCSEFLPELNDWLRLYDGSYWMVDINTDNLRPIQIFIDILTPFTVIPEQLDRLRRLLTRLELPIDKRKFWGD